uniref:Putative lipocalin lipocalin n=1 Tax=Rhipicephalus microplus TaxID=6941 RepID=A0A6G5A5Z6_RHIMP
MSFPGDLGQPVNVRVGNNFMKLDASGSSAVLRIIEVVSVDEVVVFNHRSTPSVQKYQDVNRCGPMVEDYYLVYRNYLYDSQYGGTSRCVKFHKIVPYTDIHGLTKISWARHGFARLYMHGHDTVTSTPGYTARNLHTITSHHEPAAWNHHTIYSDCTTCYIGRHHYARNGYGCTLWRAASIISQNRTDYCDFIFDAVCGSSPKYYIYDPACEDVPETIVTKKAPWSE